MPYALLAAGFLDRVTAVPIGAWLTWSALVALCVSLVVVMRTRWGHSRPLQKCAVLSLLVHLVFACLAMTVRIVVGDGGGGSGIGPPVRVRIVDDATDHVVGVSAFAPADDIIQPPPLLEPPAASVEAFKEAATEPPAEEGDAEIGEAELVEDEPESDSGALPPIEATAEDAMVAVPAAVPIVAEAAPKPVDPPTPPAEQTRIADPSTSSNVAASPVVPAAPAAASAANAVPVVAAPAATYALRTAPGRLGLIERQGGNVQTEAAVVAALRWLAAAQSSDGRWEAARFGAGREQAVLGHNRHGAGRDADTGISALALLAFLGAGHSHRQGDHQATVRHGLEFLVRNQDDAGGLFGEATLYARMYCHSMATFALGEALAMTGDQRLKPPLERAVNYSVRAQHPATGGWRYQPGDPGDTSQLGWQMMALASAERAGIEVPPQTWIGVERFLRSVRRGTYGGLSSYRPDSGPSTSMTAEGFYCRLLLNETHGTALDERASVEATGQLLASLPDADQVNLYYWYYATLALHHRQEANQQAAAAWHAWNDALTAVLLANQVPTGPDAGSWNTNCLWGGYGGRVYTTAVAAMCLEVYYRYAPQSPGESRVVTRPDISPNER